MITVLFILLVGAFSICVTVGLLSVLQNLVYGNSGEDYPQGPVFLDHLTD